METYVKKIDFHFMVFNHDFIIYILPISKLQTQQLMTSQIRSHIEYLIQTDSIIVFILYLLEIDEKLIEICEIHGTVSAV